MRDEHVKRLPVVDEADTLVGIVSRADLLKVHLRSDAQIRRDVVEQVVGLVLGAAGSAVQVTATDGVVTLRGRLKFRSTADNLLRLSRQVPGVVAVTDDLRSTSTTAWSPVRRSARRSASPDAREWP